MPCSRRAGANILVSESGVAKLTDFGCSKQLLGLATQSLDDSLRLIKGSVPWMAPEGGRARPGAGGGRTRARSRPIALQ